MSQTRNISIVLFGGGPHVFGVDAGQVASIRQEAFESDVPIERLLGIMPVPHNDRLTLNLRGSRLQSAISVLRPVTIERLPVTSIFPLPDLVARKISIASAKAIAFFNERALLLVDLRVALNDLKR